MISPLLVKTSDRMTAIKFAVSRNQGLIKFTLYRPERETDDQEYRTIVVQRKKERVETELTYGQIAEVVRLFDPQTHAGRNIEQWLRDAAGMHPTRIMKINHGSRKIVQPNWLLGGLTRKSTITLI